MTVEPRCGTDGPVRPGMLMITETSRKLQAAGEQMVYITIIEWVYDRTAVHLICTAMLGLTSHACFQSIHLIFLDLSSL